LAKLILCIWRRIVLGGKQENPLKTLYIFSIKTVGQEMSKDAMHIYEFGQFRLDTADRLLLRDGNPVQLPPKSFEMLTLLIERGGRLVAKDELMKALWPDSFVEEANLNHHVWTLRKSLGDRENGNRYIETVPKHGFRFTASVRTFIPESETLVLEKHTLMRIVSESEDQTSHKNDVQEFPAQLSLPATVGNRRKARWIRSAAFGLLCLSLMAVSIAVYRVRTSSESKQPGAIVATNPQLRSIAVLPFKTIGVDDDKEYLGLGMSDALITKLGNIHRIIVRPTSAVRIYTGAQEVDPVAAGREQSVDAVLEGSIQHTVDRIRVTVQLTRVQDKALLWSGQFDEHFTNIFAVQDSISQQVVRGLLVELNPEERQRLQKHGSENIEAYQAYLKGLYFWDKRTKDGNQKAVQYFNKAIEKAPAYAQAYVGLGHAYAYLGGHDLVSERESIARQRAAAKKALELDETLSEAHASLGLIAMNSDWDWIEAEREFKRSIELSPNYATAHAWYGEFLTFMGRFEDGLAEIKRGQELDPLSLVINTDVAKVYTLARRYDEAIEQYKRALEMDPAFEVAHGLLALTYSLKEMHEEALGELRKIKDLEKDPMYLSFLVYVYGRSGRIDKARGMVNRMVVMSKQAYISPLWMTIGYAGLGEMDQAFEWLKRIFDERTTGGTIALKVSPVYDSLRSDPRFADIVQRAGFAP
jgi:DNA-binding winged helix-turn-helix (wHTH) protein/TolB-like protein/Tfp pilus assembly protein PilF